MIRSLLVMSVLVLSVLASNSTNNTNVCTQYGNNCKSCMNTPGCNYCFGAVQMNRCVPSSIINSNCSQVNQGADTQDRAVMSLQYCISSSGCAAGSDSYDCGSCSANAQYGCGYCYNTGACMSPNSGCDASFVYPASCSVVPCVSRHDCDSCFMDNTCAWCSTGNSIYTGSCQGINASGSSQCYKAKSSCPVPPPSGSSTMNVAAALIWAMLFCVMALF